MKLVANLKLTPTDAQHEALHDTLVVSNRACTWLAGHAWDTNTFGQFALHKLTYKRCREAVRTCGTNDGTLHCESG